MCARQAHMGKYWSFKIWKKYRDILVTASSPSFAFKVHIRLGTFMVLHLHFPGIFWHVQKWLLSRCVFVLFLHPGAKIVLLFHLYMCNMHNLCGRWFLYPLEACLWPSACRASGNLDCLPQQSQGEEFAGCAARGTWWWWGQGNWGTFPVEMGLSLHQLLLQLERGGPAEVWKQSL